MLLIMEICCVFIQLIMALFYTGTVRLADLKCVVKTNVTLPDSIITQREEEEPVDEERDLSGAHSEGLVTATRARRRKTTKPTETAMSPKDETEEKIRGRRQRDFDVEQEADMLEDSDEESRKKERSRALEDLWTQNHQKLLELALQQYPKGTAERWDKIAKCVPGKSKVRTKISFYFLVLRDDVFYCLCHRPVGVSEVWLVQNFFWTGWGLS